MTKQRAMQQDIQVERTTPPFTGPNGHYCNHCESYSNDFYESAIKTQYRRCRPCHQEKVQLRKSKQTQLSKLAKRLKYNFVYQKRSDLAKLVTHQQVLEILKENDIVYEQQLDTVKTIAAKYDAKQEAWMYKVVLKR